ncbi:choloylglycine hydrolase family protein [Companilactobacillus kimchiensis]|uniref:Choloylglycine hydrolase (Bile salt hydrolase) n=1 Tax=Companilactobacillus kimchiensis TaxID=993692 RepID=A0A0R2LEU5_9LACO|nr:choloylglycine hydrolase family protein [Companilactobacillus kimchiensis]KRN98453.1 choloylglycine hydrolase (bile salt hydrolase) [Companilactobacillus kimchiensis]
MCTSLSLGALDGSKFLARTMDFAFELNGRPTFLPEEYQWISSYDKKTYTTDYAIMGTGAKFGNNYMVADGFNEFGLSAAELYFSHAAKYETEPTEGDINVVAEEFLLWALGNNKSIAELQENIKQVHLIESDSGVMGENQPLHFIFSDATGATYILEPQGNGLVLQEDKIGVMTNTPDYNWHKTNLSNYLGTLTTNFGAKKFGDEEIIPLGQNGTFRLPGGYTAVDRFIRTAFIREATETPKDAKQAVNTILHILDSVTIPRGVNIKENGEASYTQYQTVLDLTNKIMYFVPYGNRTVYATKLSADLIKNQKEPREYSVTLNQEFETLN